MTHEITKLKIINFRSCISEQFALKRFTPIVGYNNAGKSNILAALHWLLKRTTLTASDFNNLTIPVIVEAEVSGITDNILELLAQNHRNALTRYIRDGVVRVRRFQPTPSCPAASVIFEVRDIQVPDENAPQAWGRPGAIENAIKEILPEPILISAMDDAPDDVNKVSKNNTLGQIISEIMGPVELAHGAEISESLNDIAQKLSFDGQRRAPELIAFDAAASEKISELFPGLTLKLDIAPPKIEDIFKSGSVKLFEQGYEGEGGRDFTSLGHGAQRSVQMAMIRQLAEAKRQADPAGKTTLLLIDEPELYLHPQAVENVRVSLKELTSSGYQVVFTTHAAQMIPAEDATSALLVRKNPARGTYSRQRLEDAIHQVIHDAPSQTDVLFSLTNSNQILFSEAVLLAEGKTERKLLPKIFELINGSTMLERRIALVEQNGVDNTSKSLQVLYVLDLPSRAVVDIDYAFKGAIRAGVIQENDPDIVASKAILVRLSGQHKFRLGENGLPTKKGGELTSEEAFSLLAQDQEAIAHVNSLHDKLIAHNIWMWKKGSIEDHLGNESKRENGLARYARRLDNEDIEAVIQDIESIRQFCAWLAT